MPSKEPQDLYNSFAQKKVNPIYFFYGEEAYLIRRAVEQVKDLALEDGIADFNYDSFYSLDAEVSHVRDVVETLPMMASKRVVVLKEAQELSEKEWEVLQPVITEAVDTAVFVISASKVDKRKKSIKSLLDNAISVEFKRPFENQMPQWIQFIAEQYGLTIRSDAANLIYRLVGNHLTEIDLEMSKLAAFLGDRTEVETSDVASVVSKSREESIFDLTKAVALGDRSMALSCLVNLLDQGQNEIGIVSMIARHIRMLIQVYNGLKHGYKGAQLAQYAQISTYFLNEYLQQIKFWNLKKLENTLLALNETDKALKSSPLSSHIWLENLIIKTCSKEITQSQESLSN